VVKFNLTYAGFISFGVKNISSFSKSNESFNISIMDLLNHPVSNISAIMILNGKNITCNSDDNGVMSFNVDLLEGNYSCDVYFGGNELYEPCNATFNIFISKKDTRLRSNNINMEAIVVKMDGKSGPYLEITLKDYESKELINKKVQVRLNSKTYNLVTNNKGVARLQVNVEKSGSYIAKINFLGDDKHYGSSAVSKIIVKKKKVSLTVPVRSFKSSQKAKKLTAILKTNKGKAISGKKLTFKVNGKKYVVKTNSKGIATLNIKIAKKKSYNVIVSFNGDLTFNKITKKSKFVIK
jgi:hypothetical protein